jgi:hypothetical protein
VWHQPVGASCNTTIQQPCSLHTCHPTCCSPNEGAAETFTEPHQLYHALRAQLSESVPEDVLWDDDDGGFAATTKEQRAERQKQELLNRLERRLGLETNASTPSSSAPTAPGMTSAGGPGAGNVEAAARGGVLRCVLLVGAMCVSCHLRCCMEC